MSRPVYARLVSRIVAITLVSGMLTGLLAACGYKGPLYLPDPGQNTQASK